jgi:hypothetical protein
LIELKCKREKPQLLSTERVPYKGVDMFEKTIVDIWFDPDTFNQFLISVNDEGTLFLTEKFPEVVK